MEVYEFVSPDLPPLPPITPVSNADCEKNPCCTPPGSDGPVKVCKFSDPKTWGPSGVPSANDTEIIYVPKHVTLELDASAKIRFWIVEGTLVAARGKDLALDAEGVFVNPAPATYKRAALKTVGHVI